MDSCNPSPCGPNALCTNGQCHCIENHQGDPFLGCRPECVLNTDCPNDKACSQNKCINPCINTCADNAICHVYNHIPMCSCPQRMTGSAFIECHNIELPISSNPCHPSPCGPNSHCREINGQSVCACIPGFYGSPPQCRPECVVSSDCSLDKACSNQKCIDPCQGSCGFKAICRVVKHNPICSCPPTLTGNPFVSCSSIGT